MEEQTAVFEGEATNDLYFGDLAIITEVQLDAVSRVARISVEDVSYQLGEQSVLLGPGYLHISNWEKLIVKLHDSTTREFTEPSFDSLPHIDDLQVNVQESQTILQGFDRDSGYYAHCIFRNAECHAEFSTDTRQLFEDEVFGRHLKKHGLDGDSETLLKEFIKLSKEGSDPERCAALFKLLFDVAHEKQLAYYNEHLRLKAAFEQLVNPADDQ